MVKDMNPHMRRSSRQRLSWRLGKAAPRYPTGAYQHARSAWDRAVIHSADLGDLAFIGHLAGHVSRCRECAATWIEGDRPVQYLEAAVMRSPVRDVWMAAVRQSRSPIG